MNIQTTNQPSAAMLPIWRAVLIEDAGHIDGIQCGREVPTGELSTKAEAYATARAEFEANPAKVYAFTVRREQ